MKDKKTKFLVGLFVATGLAMIVGTVIWLGTSNYFKKGNHYSIFFDESVQGLTVEAPVKYRGVPIGRVQLVKVAADSRLIEVVIELDQDFMMQDQVAAQLKVVGITGTMFIELDHLEDQANVPIETTLNFPTEFPVIPSRSSDIKQLFTSVDDIVQKLRTIDIAALANGLQKTISDIDHTIVTSDVAGLSSQIQSTLKSIDTILANSNIPGIMQHLSSLIEHLDQSLQEIDIASLSNEAQETLATLRKETHDLASTSIPLLTSTNRTVNSADKVLDNFNRQLLVTSQKMEKTNAKLNDLLDHISDQPSQLLFGEPPSRRLK